MKTRYPLPEELISMMCKAAACVGMRDKIIGTRFRGLYKAQKYAEMAATLHLKFWCGFYDLYPELKGRACTYSLDGFVTLDSDYQ